jgi:hypothetical protein
MTEIASGYAARSIYLFDRGFRRGRYNEYERRAEGFQGRDCVDWISMESGGWMVGTMSWELGPFPDPITAFIAAELADWGRTS